MIPILDASAGSDGARFCHGDGFLRHRRGGRRGARGSRGRYARPYRRGGATASAQSRALRARPGGASEQRPSPRRLRTRASDRCRLGFRGRAQPRQGHAERSLGDDGRSGRPGFRHFPGRAAELSAGVDRCADRRGRPTRTARQLPRLGHRDHCRARRRAHRHRQADYLYLGRQRAADRRA